MWPLIIKDVNIMWPLNIKSLRRDPDNFGWPNNNKLQAQVPDILQHCFLSRRTAWIVTSLALKNQQYNLQLIENWSYALVLREQRPLIMAQRTLPRQSGVRKNGACYLNTANVNNNSYNGRYTIAGVSLAPTEQLRHVDSQG
eukprot:jgi/Botrbrau1/21252/Bobra.39_2s0046.1